MVRAKIIKTESEHSAALAELERLIDINPEIGSSDSDQLELLSLLIENYETHQFPIELPDPIEAIEFCMDQHGLTQKDLVPYIGSRSKVSEVLSRKRPLTLSMIRALHEGLSIPAKILLKNQAVSIEQEEEIDWDRFPLKEAIKRGWIRATVDDAKNRAEELLREFFEPLGGIQESPILCKRTHHVRVARNANPYALEMWRAIVLRDALNEEVSEYNPSILNKTFLTEIAHLSWADNGPLLARDFLKSFGIILVVRDHLSRTYLDGACFVSPMGNPVIGLTLRYDRIDNFWFVLMHELVHVWKHVDQYHQMFIDDLDQEKGLDELEKEADTLASEILIPLRSWEDSEACHFRSAYAANALAEKLRIHPAIVAGKIRHETKNYRKLNQLVGHGKVRKLFGLWK